MKKTLSAVMALALGLSLVAGTKAVDVDTLLGLKKVSKTESKQQIDLTEAKKSLEALEAEFKVLVADVSARRELVALYCNHVDAHKVLKEKLERKEAADKFVEENKEELKDGFQLTVEGSNVVFEKIQKIDRETKKKLEAKGKALESLLAKFEQEKANPEFANKVAKKEVVTEFTILGLYTKTTETTNQQLVDKAKETLKKEVEELAKEDGKYQVSLKTIKSLADQSHADLQVLFVLAEKKLALLEKLVEKHDLDPKLFDKSCPAPGRLINHPAGEKETKETTEKKAKKDNVPNTASAAAAASLAFATIFAAAAAVVAKKKKKKKKKN